MKLPDKGAIPRIRGPEASQPTSDAMAKLVLSWVDGKATIAEIGEMCGMTGEMAQRIVGDLASHGVVEVPGFEGNASAAPTGATGGSQSEQGFVSEANRIAESLETTNFYDLLGVEPDADRKQLRSAYFAMSKKFHPDRAFGKDEGDMRRKMELIFRRMTQAYDVLSNATQREEYDKYIADQLEVWRIEKQLKDALAIEKGLDQPSPTAEARGPSSAPPKAGRASQRPVRQKRPVEPATTRPTSRPSIPAKDPGHEARRKRWRRERAGRALKGALKRSGSFTTQRPQSNVELVAQASIAVEREQHADAIALLERALSADSHNTQARELLARAQAGAAQELARGYIRQGMYERRQGDVVRARAHFEKALETDVKSVDARYQLADLLLETRSELPRALSLCKEVVGMGGQRARYFATLGELLLLAKQQDRAGEAFRKALNLEPGNKEYKKRLKACGV
jgi:curved DNA-binding protein CbpA